MSLLYRLLVAVEHCRRVLREVDRECSGMGVEREASAISQDSGSRPATEDRVHHAVGIPQQVMAMTDRQIIDVVGADDVPGIEQRIGTAGPQIGQVANQPLSAERELVGVVDDV